MLTQLFNPTEIKKNGPATRPAIAPARLSASPLQAALAVLPATSQSYGAARVIVNGDHHASVVRNVSAEVAIRSQERLAPTRSTTEAVRRACSAAQVRWCAARA